MKYKKTSTIVLSGLILLSSILLSSCALQKYEASPINPTENANRYLAHNPNSREFKDYLSSVNYTYNEFPIKAWGLSEFTLAALFFNPELDLARAQWRAAVASQTTARQKPIPGSSTKSENHSNDSGISPWTMGLSIDIPIETGGKRQARIDRAVSLSEAARYEIGQSAWRIRARVVQSWINYEYNLNLSLLLQRESALREDVVTMLEQRVSKGLSSSIELNNARIQLQKTQQQLNEITSRLPSVRSSLAASAGLDLEVLEKLNLATSNQVEYVEKALHQDGIDAIYLSARESALLNRLDIRSALARYDAAEAKLRLEIAKQYPDIVI